VHTGGRQLIRCREGTGSRTRVACVAVPSRVSFFFEQAQSGVADATVFAATFDTLVAILIQTTKVLPHILLPATDNVALLESFEALLEFSDSVDVKLVLVALEVAKLCELFVALVKLAGERLRGCMHDLVRSYIAALGESLAADVALVRAFTGMATLVSLQIAELGKSLTTGWLTAHKRLDTSVSACMDFEMSLLVERFVAIRHGTVVPLPDFGGTRLLTRFYNSNRRLAKVLVGQKE